MLQLWEHFFLIAENQKPHLTIKFEDFATSPEEVIEGIYTKINICYKPLEYSKVHPPNPPYEHKNIVWDEALIKHKIDSDYLYKNF